jgi:hypothetical protein
MKIRVEGEGQAGDEELRCRSGGAHVAGGGFVVVM